MAGIILAGQLLLFAGFVAAISLAAQSALSPSSVRDLALSLSSQRNFKTGIVAPASIWARGYLGISAIGFGCIGYGGVWFGLSWIPADFGSVSDGEFTSLRQAFAFLGAITGAALLTYGALLFAEYRQAYLDHGTPPQPTP